MKFGSEFGRFFGTYDYQTLEVKKIGNAFGVYAYRWSDENFERLELIHQFRSKSDADKLIDRIYAAIYANEQSRAIQKTNEKAKKAFTLADAFAGL